ncbi:HD family phosphohydrolase [Arenimonas soli]|uniref:HD family phosphohydrolase n=2 Tax=Arenimonas soli TaxID=2269504 RepID=A0ABQ1HBS0_9GAMM|nr:HD family phosphohydrolase [Arenimonas soli]
MVLEERQMLVGLLEKGMYISRLDRDWVGTPFPFQGFEIKSDEDIELLSAYCTSVFIDVQKSLINARPSLRVASTSRNVFPPRGPEYQNTVDIKEEIPRAREIHANLRALAERIADDVRNGRRLEPGVVREAIEPMVESLLRNSDALFWLMALMKRDDYMYSHAVNCSALAAAFGRHLALPREVLVELATGGFLLDAGMATLPSDVVHHDGKLDAEAMKQMRGHVQRSMDVLDQAGVTGKWARELVSGHHERHDGSGYPEGLAGDRVPLAGRMGGVVDTYDALRSDRPHRNGESRHGALQALYRARDRMFQGEVVEQFLQCLGVYPTGSLVELNTGEVGVVMAQNQVRRLRPRLMLLLDSEKKPYEPFRDVDLMQYGFDLADGGVKIAQALEPGAYGLRPEELFL